MTKTLQIGHYYGTQEYHSLKPLFHTVATDGVKYVMDNGYSWFITDSVAVIENPQEIPKLVKHLAEDNFLSVVLDATDKDDIKMIIGDGNDNILYTQKYDFIISDYDLPNDKLELFWINGSPYTLPKTPAVYMLTGEY